MSTKTLRKRVALIAVSAMGFGLLSGVSAANAVNSGGELSLTSGASIGLLASDITSGTSGTATLLSTGRLALTVESSTTLSVVKVSAGAVIESATYETISADQQSADKGLAVNNGTLVIRPTGAVGSTFTVASYFGAAPGTLKDLITVTIAGSSVSGTATAAKSNVVWSNTPTLGTNGTNIDSASANETTTGKNLWLNVQIKDAYGAKISSTTGSLIVTASSGATVGFGQAGTYSTAVSGNSPENTTVWVSEATAGAGWSGTITVTYNGVAIATKSGKITGNVAKLTVEAVKIAKSDSATSLKAISFKAADAAGNALALAASAVKLSDSSDKSVVSGIVTTTNDASTTDVGYVHVSAGKAGSSTVTLETTIASTGAVVKSNAITVLVGGTADSFSASLDKAKYAQGDVAKLTLTFKDAKGNLANSYDSVTSLNGTKESISFPQGSQIGTITGAESPNAKGQIEIRFNIDGGKSTFTAGKYNTVVTYPTPANAAVQTVAYEVTGAGGVSNSDILASIVKLITAINKQIAALQKLLLKK